MCNGAEGDITTLLSPGHERRHLLMLTFILEDGALQSLERPEKAEHTLTSFTVPLPFSIGCAALGKCLNFDVNLQS